MGIFIGTLVAICSAVSIDSDSGMVLLDANCPTQAEVDVYVTYAWGEAEEPASIVARDGRIAFVREGGAL